MRKITLDGSGGNLCVAFTEGNSFVGITVEDAIGELVRNELSIEFAGLLHLDNKSLGDFIYKNRDNLDLEIVFLPCYTAAYCSNKEGFDVCLKAIIDSKTVPSMMCESCRYTENYVDGDFGKTCEKCGSKDHTLVY